MAAKKRKRAKKKSSRKSSKGKTWSCTLKRKGGGKGHAVRRKASKKPKSVKVGKRRIKASCKLVKR